MADDCFLKITNAEKEEKLKEIFGDTKISKEALRRLVDDIEKIKRASENSVELKGNMESRLREYIKNKREEAKLNKAARKVTLLKLKDEVGKIKKGFYENPVEGLNAGIVSTTDPMAANAKRSAEFQGVAMGQEVNNYAVANLQKEGLLRQFVSGVIDRNVWVEVRALAENRGIGQTNDPIAMGIAKWVHNSNKLMFKMFRNVGVAIRELPEYVVTLHHDMSTLKAAGKEAWVADMKTRNLDKKKMFGDDAGNLKAEHKILESMYDGATKGKVGLKSELSVETFDDLPTGANLHKKATETRHIHFLDGASEYDYHAKWGGGKTLAELFFSNVNRKTRMMGLMGIYGDNPERAILKAMDVLQADYMKAGRHDLADEVRNGRQKVMNKYMEVSGKLAVPGVGTAATLGRVARMVNVLSKLFNAGIRSITNIPLAAMQIRNATGKNYFEALHFTVTDFVKNLPAGEQRATSRRLGFFLQDFVTDLHSAFGASGGELDAKAARLMFKVNGMDWINTASQSAYTKGVMMGVHEATQVGWAKMDPQMKAFMLSAGITEKDFAVLGHASELMPDGRHMVTSTGIDAIPEEVISARVKEFNENLPKGFKKSGKMTADAYRQKLKYDYLGAIQQGRMASSTSPGARERSMFTQGTYLGDPWGEVLRTFGQFKSFWVQNYNIFKAASNSLPDGELLDKGILKRGRTDYVTPAQAFTVMIGFGYVAQALIDMSHGDNPQDPTQLKTWMNAMARSGAGGIFTDAFGADSNAAEHFSENLLGPTFGQLAGPAYKTAVAARDKALGLESSNVKMTPKITGLIKSNLPFGQAWGIQTGVHWVLDKQINEMMNPGSTSRQDRKNRLRDRKERLTIPFGG